MYLSSVLGIMKLPHDLKSSFLCVLVWKMVLWNSNKWFSPARSSSVIDVFVLRISLSRATPSSETPHADCWYCLKKSVATVVERKGLFRLPPNWRVWREWFWASPSQKGKIPCFPITQPFESYLWIIPWYSFVRCVVCWMYRKDPDQKVMCLSSMHLQVLFHFSSQCHCLLVLKWKKAVFWPVNWVFTSKIECC